MSGLTGAQAAERILHQSGIYDVRIEHIRGKLNDHYDPRTKVLRLSDSTFFSDSVAAIGVAAHECGHAIQHQKQYGPLVLRSTLVPAANLCDGADFFDETASDGRDYFVWTCRLVSACDVACRI